MFPMPKFKTIRDLNLAGKRVLMRVDFNVPQDKATGAITNNQRIVAALPTIKYALEQGASVVLMSHLGRPDGKVIAKFSLKPVAAEARQAARQARDLPRRLRRPGRRAACARRSKAGDVVLLENLRFHIEEEGKVKLEDGTSVKADPARRSRRSAPASRSSATSTSTTPSAPRTARTRRWSASSCRRRPPVS
jgi:phosphoglycerate kinase